MVVLTQQPEVYQLSDKSTPAVPDSFFHATEFILGAGIVAIQPSTGKIVVVCDGRRGSEERWFFPKGRKDEGESLDKTALREGYEESGYQIVPLPLYSGSLAPDAPAGQGTTKTGNQSELEGPQCSGITTTTTAITSTVVHTRKDTEPIAVTIQNWNRTAVFSRGGNGEYLTFWYVGQISDDAVRETGTGMEFEDNFRSYLLTFEEAREKITVEVDRHVLDTAWRAWQMALQIDRGEVVV